MKPEIFSPVAPSRKPEGAGIVETSGTLLEVERVTSVRAELRKQRDLAALRFDVL